jgi:hypothetical protein
MRLRPWADAEGLPLWSRKQREDLWQELWEMLHVLKAGAQAPRARWISCVAWKSISSGWRAYEDMDTTPMLTKQVNDTAVLSRRLP